jgi:HSP20 family protein
VECPQEDRANDFFETDWWFNKPSYKGYNDKFYPLMESYVKGNDLHMRAEVPGVDPKDISIDVKDGHLCVRGERKLPESVKDSSVCFEEMSYGFFERCFHIPRGVDSGKVHAKYEYGVLDIFVPLGKSSVGKKIPIEGVV